MGDQSDPNYILAVKDIPGRFGPHLKSCGSGLSFSLEVVENRYTWKKCIEYYDRWFVTTRFGVMYFRTWESMVSKASRNHNLYIFAAILLSTKFPVGVSVFKLQTFVFALFNYY